MDGSTLRLSRAGGEALYNLLGAPESFKRASPGGRVNPTDYQPGTFVGASSKAGPPFAHAQLAEFKP